VVRAGDLAAPFPTVHPDTSAMAAAQLMARLDLPGLIVVDRVGRPVTVLPGTQVLRMAVPRYCLDDPALARVIDEAGADVFVRELGDRTVADCLPAERRELPVVDSDATVLEIAALMARARSPLVAVIDEHRVMRGAVTLEALLDRILAP
jgi:CBS domain-containing protein